MRTVLHVVALEVFMGRGTTDAEDLNVLPIRQA